MLVLRFVKCVQKLDIVSYWDTISYSLILDKIRRQIVAVVDEKKKSYTKRKLRKQSPGSVLILIFIEGGRGVNVPVNVSWIYNITYTSYPSLVAYTFNNVKFYRFFFLFSFFFLFFFFFFFFDRLVTWTSSGKASLSTK